MMNFRRYSAFLALGLAAVAFTALPAFAADKDKKSDSKKDDAAPAAIPAGGGASAPTAQGGYKIGVVDIEDVVENYPKKTRLMGDLQKQVDADQKEIDAETDHLKSLQEAFDKGKDKFSDSEKSAKAAEIQDLVTNLKSDREKKQSKIDRQEAAIKQDVFGDVNKAIQKIAESENYHLILNSRGVPNSSVLYASPTIDLSAKVKAALGDGGGSSAPSKGSK